MAYTTTNNELSLHVLVQLVCYSHVDMQFSITSLFLLSFATRTDDVSRKT